MLYELKNIRKKNGLTQVEAASIFNVPLSTYRNWEQCKNVPQDAGVVKSIADRFGVPMEALYGYDAMAPGSLTGMMVNDDEDAMQYVPVVSELAAGIPVLPEYVEYHMPVPAEVMRKHPHSALFKVVGTSMDRVLPNGSLALVDFDMVDVAEGRAYAVKVDGDESTIKRIRRTKDGLSLVPDSITDPTWENIDFKRGEDGKYKELTIIGRVVYYMLPFDWDV